MSALGCSLEVRRVGVAVDTIPVTRASPSDLYRTPEGIVIHVHVVTCAVVLLYG